MQKRLLFLLVLTLVLSAQMTALAVEPGKFDTNLLKNWNDAAIKEAYGVSAADFRPSNPQPLTYIAAMEPVIDPKTGRESEGGYSREHRIHPVSTSDVFWKAADLSLFSLTLTDDPDLATYRASIAYQYVKDGLFNYSEGKARIPKYTGVLTVTLTNLLTGESASVSHKNYSFTVGESVRKSIVDEGIGKQFYGGCSRLQEKDISAFNDLLGLGDAALFKYKDDEGGGILITGYRGDKVESLKVPVTIEGRPVTGIGEEALTAEYYAAVSLPDTLTHIDKHAFWGNRGIESIVIPPSVTEIGEGAFASSTLKSVVLPDGFERIPASAFQGCQLKSIVVPDSVVEIGKSAFEYCRNLETASLPENLRTIGESSFDSCDKLKSLTLPSGLCEIGASAFEHCDALKSLTVPEEVRVVGEAAFKKCASLSEVIFEGEVDRVGKEAFFGCEKLSNVTFQRGVKAVESLAFATCARLKTIDLTGLEFLGSGAFGGAESLKRFYLPETLTEIDGNPFAFRNGYVHYAAPKSLELVVAEGSFAEKWAQEADMKHTVIAPPTEAELAEQRYPALKTGSKGEEVRRLQKTLIDRGYLEGSADGQFGKKTATAVSAAQADMGMEADGIATGLFQQKLYESEASEP